MKTWFALCYMATLLSVSTVYATSCPDVPAALTHAKYDQYGDDWVVFTMPGNGQYGYTLNNTKQPNGTVADAVSATGTQTLNVTSNYGMNGAGTYQIIISPSAAGEQQCNSAPVTVTITDKAALPVDLHFDASSDTLLFTLGAHSTGYTILKNEGQQKQPKWVTIASKNTLSAGQAIQFKTILPCSI